MARLKKNSLLSALSGALGQELVFKQYTDKTVVSKYPDMSGVKPSPLQVLQRQQIGKANAYAQFAKQDPKLMAFYEKGLKPGESVYHKAKKAYFDQVSEP